MHCSVLGITSIAMELLLTENLLHCSLNRVRSTARAALLHDLIAIKNYFCGLLAYIDTDLIMGLHSLIV